MVFGVLNNFNKELTNSRAQVALVSQRKGRRERLWGKISWMTDVRAVFKDEYVQKNCTKKDLHDPDNHDGVITHLEPDILEWEVRWALESITRNQASGGDGIPVEPFQILKDDAVKVLHSICQQIWKTQPWPQDWKRSVFIPIPKKGNPKECSNYHTIALFSC